MKLLAAALALLPVASLAQDVPASDALRINPLTGGPRSAFDPTSGEEAQAALGACLDRAIQAGADVEAAVADCHEQTLAACRDVAALYPLASDECLMEQGFAWSNLRNDAGLAVTDLLYASDAPADRKEAEAFVEADGEWRTENGNACLVSDPDEQDACTLGREMDRAALYLGQLAAMLEVTPTLQP